ncbi:MAG: hypothetical protein SP1CHLAM54_07110 [Chlamydiia bacterium]|nr:hypothetical protein [Chlamydiia bacterium]MCH9615617.1 hypothetical protein [Chlamydiia bacterium]MCH9628980.1 hypothetical protein [Chlamydiia bacterium]
MIELKSDHLLVDEDFQLKIPLGLSLKASMVDDIGRRWVSLTKGEEPMDFITKMKPTKNPSLYFKRTLNPTKIELELLDGDQVLDTQILTQDYTREGVTFEDVGDARVYSPAKPIEDAPGVIVLAGSSGGRKDTTAALLASRGFTAMALPYFRFNHLPEQLEHIPLEYFHNPIKWMRDKCGAVALHGTSKGGELALLLASMYPIDRVVAVVPSCATYGGFPNFFESSWTLEGTGLPVAPVKVPSVLDSPIKATPFFMETIDQIEAALLPFSQISCPLLLIAAGDDQMWPSNEFCKIIKHYLPRSKLLLYENAGHMITHPYIPTAITQSLNPVDGRIYEMGGEMEAHQLACVNSWMESLRFLSY